MEEIDRDSRSHYATPIRKWFPFIVLNWYNQSHRALGCMRLMNLGFRILEKRKLLKLIDLHKEENVRRLIKKAHF